MTLWLAYGEIWEGESAVGKLYWWMADGAHVVVGVLMLTGGHARVWQVAFMSFFTGILLVLVPVSRSTDFHVLPWLHAVLFLLLWYVEMGLAGALYSGVDFTYLFLVCLPVLRVHTFLMVPYLVVLVPARVFEATSRWSLRRLQETEQEKEEKEQLVQPEGPEAPEQAEETAVDLPPPTPPPPPPPPPEPEPLGRGVPAEVRRAMTRARTTVRRAAAPPPSPSAAAQRGALGAAPRETLPIPINLA